MDVKLKVPTFALHCTVSTLVLPPELRSESRMWRPVEYLLIWWFPSAQRRGDSPILQNLTVLDCLRYLRM